MKKLSGISSRAGTVGAAIAIVGVAGITGATAANTIGSSDIKDGSIKGQDVQNGSLKGADIANGSITLNDLKDSSEAALKGQKGDTGPAGPAGPQGIPGPIGPASPGDTGLAGAYYSIAYYDEGNTNAGAIATVACKLQTDVAISGGVQVLGLDADANSRNTPVSSSFPGRMDFAANPPVPKANRLDGWIVQFGGVNEKPPLKTKIWALCVPGATIPVEETYNQPTP